MMRKIAFFDLDGTLCSGGDLHVSLEIKQAFQSMRENEIEPVIATGRSFYEVQHLLTFLEVENYILSNGCYVKFKGKLIQNATMSIVEIQHILAIANEYNIGTGFFNQNGFALTMDNPIVQQHMRSMGSMDIEFNEKFFVEQPVNFMNLYLNAKTERVIREKIIAVSDIERYAPLALDILPKGVSKGQAINLLLEKVSDSRVITYAFGNQNNDISMFKTVNYGMSMKESTAELKQLSSYIAKTDNGVLEGLKHFKLI